MILYIHTHTHPVPPPPGFTICSPPWGCRRTTTTLCAHLVPATCIVRRRCAVRWPVLHARILLLLIFILLLLLLYIGTHLCTKTLWGLNVRLRFSQRCSGGGHANGPRGVGIYYIIMCAARYTYIIVNTIRFIYIL